jgi:glycosyltransferase involved in cell wall biosynthesis
MDSILAQSFHEWELIIVDDHSTDETPALLLSFAEADPRIQCYQNQGKGIIPALQLALSKTQGEFITRMDSDDLMPENRLKKMVEAVTKSPEKTIVTGLVSYFSDQAVSEGYLTYEHWLNEVNIRNTQWKNVYRECVIASPNWMMRTDELKQMGGFDTLIYPEDYHLVLRWYQHDFQIKTIPETTLLWREHPARTSRNSAHYNQHHFFNLKINEFLRHDWNKQPLILWGTNPKAKITAQILDETRIPYTQMDLNAYRSLENYPSSQLLVAVYPPEKEKTLLERYLTTIDRLEGKDWWYL